MPSCPNQKVLYFTEDREEEVNLAVAGIASQSSIYKVPTFYFADLPHHAIDGSFKPEQTPTGVRLLDVLKRGPCARTRKERGAWWQVDLSEEYKVLQVIITSGNRHGELSGDFCLSNSHLISRCNNLFVLPILQQKKTDIICCQ